MNATDSWYGIPQIKPLIEKFDGMKLIAELTWNTTLVISYKGTWFQISDNSGEINVNKINSNDIRPFPTTGEVLENLNAETLMYRLLQVVKDEEIDYQHREVSYLV